MPCPNILTLGFGLAFCGHLLTGLIQYVINRRTHRNHNKIALPARHVGCRRYGPHRRNCRWTCRCRYSKIPCLLVRETTELNCTCNTESKISTASCVNAFTDLDLRGGHGGGASAATKRKRNERELLNGLRSLLESFASDDSPSFDQDTGDAHANEEPDSLLDALKSLIAKAENNPRSLLNDSKTLCANAEAGNYHVDDSPPAFQPTEHTTYRQRPKEKERS